jgi:hypothetical protein
MRGGGAGTLADGTLTDRRRLSPLRRSVRGIEFRLDSISTVHEECHDCPDQEDDEENFCDSSSAGRNAAKAEDGGNQCDNQKNDSIVKHGIPLFLRSIDVGQATGAPKSSPAD